MAVSQKTKTQKQPAPVVKKDKTIAPAEAVLMKAKKPRKPKKPKKPKPGPTMTDNPGQIDDHRKLG